MHLWVGLQVIHPEDKVYIIRTLDGEYGTARHIGAYFTLVTFEGRVPEPILNEDIHIISEITLLERPSFTVIFSNVEPLYLITPRPAVPSHKLPLLSSNIDKTTLCDSPSFSVS